MATLLKPFVINSTDIQFILDQLNFKPLFDAVGNAVILWDGTTNIYNQNHALIFAPVPGLLPTDPQALANVDTYGQSYQSATDLAGLRDVTGLNNNLALVNNAYGAVDQIFTRSAAADYANYSPIMQAVADGAYAAAKQYYSKYAYAPIYTDATHTTAVTNWDGTGTVYKFDGTAINGGVIAGDTASLAALSAYGSGDGGFKAGAADYTITDINNIQNVVDYTPRMISLTTTTAGVTYDTWANHQHLNIPASQVLYDAAGTPLVNWNGTGAIYNSTGTQLWDGVGSFSGTNASGQAVSWTNTDSDNGTDTALFMTPAEQAAAALIALQNQAWTTGPVYDVNGVEIAGWDGTGAIYDVAAAQLWDGVSSFSGTDSNGDSITWTNTDSDNGPDTALTITPAEMAAAAVQAMQLYGTSLTPNPDAPSHTVNEIYYDAQGVATVLDWGQLETVANGGQGQVDTQVRLDASAGQNDHFIGGLNPGVSPSNGFFVLFGQFFDHGLDFIDKGGQGAKIKIALAADDPLYGQIGADGQPVHEITINRATVDTITTYTDANGVVHNDPQYVNHTSPFIDQSQTYGSHEQLTTLLREWVVDPATGNFHAGMSLFDGNTLVNEWKKADGTPTHETLPTLSELRFHIEHTGRAELTWEDVSNLRNRDPGDGHLTGGASGSALILDMSPRFDQAHLSPDDLDVNGVTTWDSEVAAKVSNAVNVLSAPLATGSAGLTFSAVRDIVGNVTGLQLVITDGAGAAYHLPNGTYTGATALAPWINFENFGITAVDPAIHAAVGEILMASVGDHYIAGDGRVNENFGLTSVHHIFHEEHNYQVQNLINALYTQDVVTNDTNHDKLHEFQIDSNNGVVDLQGNYVTAGGAITWDLDKLFNGAKLIVEMEYQHAAVDQYARNVTPNIQEFVGYSPDKNPAVSLEYAQAAFRFGHSTLRETIDTIDPTHGLTGKIMGYALKEAFLSPEKYAANGPAAVLLGMSHQQMNEVDEFITPALNQGLLGQPLDLGAINIARGRDIGLPTLNDFREAIGLVKYTSWNDFGQNMQHQSSLVNFIAAYSFDGNMAKASAIIGLVDGTIAEGSTAAEGFTLEQANAFLSGDETLGGTGTLGFNQIDTWLGGLAEIHQPGGLLGETFDKVFVNQIESLMDGDRFYYLFRLAGQQFAEEVGNGQLKDIVERNTGLTHLNGNIFGYADQYVDLGAKKEVVAPGAEAQTTGNEHKWGDIAAVDAGTMGVYSNGGRGNLNDGHVVRIGGVQYIQDTRLAADNPNSHYNDPLSPYYNPAYAQNDFVNLDLSPNSGADSSEVIVGSKGNDLLYAQSGDDTVYGDGGNDIIFGGFGIDRLYGGDGADTIYGGDNPDLMDGGAGDDILHGDSSGSDINGNDQVIGGSGNDKIYGDTGIDKLSGGTGDDTIYGGQDTDPFTHGSDGNDYVSGDSGGDIEYGDNGDDVIAGGADQDQLFGGNGDDILRPGDSTGALTIGTDEVLGGDGVNDEGSTPGTIGFDIVDFSDNTVRAGGVKFDLANQLNPGLTVNGTPTQIATFQIEGVIGSGGGDGIIGDAGGNWLVGGSGNDTITAGAGNDVIIGGHIRLDTLIGTYQGVQYDADGFVVKDGGGNVTLTGVASSYDHNLNNTGQTGDQQLLDALYQGASYRVGYADVLSAGLLDNASIGTQDFAKHFNDMLRSDQFKTIALGDAGVDGTADTAVYAGNRSDYTVSLVQFTSQSEGLIKAVKISGIAGTAGEADGTDLLVGIEKLKFADTPNAITLANFFNVAPTITSAAVNAAFAENTAQAVVPDQNSQTLAGSLIAQLTAADTLTAGQIAFGGVATPLTWSIANAGALPADLFAIDNTGKLTFVTAPNFEALKTAAASVNAAGTELTFNVQVQVSDGDLVTTQMETVKITNIDEAGTGGTSFAYAVNAGNTAVALTASNTLADLDLVTAANTTGAANPNVTYQWQYSNNGGGSWTNLTGAAAATANLTPANNINNSIDNPLRVVATYSDAFGPHTVNSTAIEVGNANANTLGGTTGADVLIGLGGNDTYTVNTAGDVVVEAANAGTDTVQTTLASYTLGTNLENLTYTGAAAFTGVGNTAANTITGGGAIDTLTGGLGNDTLNGGGGIDTAVFAGTFANHTVTLNGSNQIVVTGINGNTDGTDTLTSIEKLQFSDATVSLQVGTNNGDTLTATTAPELFFGLSGTDTVSYVNSAIGVNASLASGTATNGDRFNSIENLTGSSSADRLAGNSANNVLSGGGDIDTAEFSGTYAAATFSFNGGSVTVTSAGDGQDTINSIERLQFADTAVSVQVGADGVNDSFTAGSPPELFFGGTGTDTVTYTGASAVNANLATGTATNGDRYFSIENVTGGSGTDTLTGNTSNNVLKGGGGIDTAVFTGAVTNHTVTLNAANDVVVAGSGGNTDGSDTLTSIEKVAFGATTYNLRSGTGGNDSFAAATAPELFVGGAGSDTVVYAGATPINASLATGTATNGDRYYGIENLTGGDGADTLTGDGNGNVLTGGAGNDTLDGGGGNDTFVASKIVGSNDGNDTYIGGGGTDTYDISATSADTTVVLTTGAGGYAYSFDTAVAPAGSGFNFDTLNGIENVIGSTGNNSITGSTGVNVLNGLGGNDTLTGGGGDDTLIGGAGNDTMYGTGGNVVFMFQPGFGNDAINDFDANPGGGGQDFLDLTGFTGAHNITAANFASLVSIVATDLVGTANDRTDVTIWTDATHTITDGTIRINGVNGAGTNVITIGDFQLHL
jgi:Ca2+-binding RTX toxin-like protein